MSSLACEASRCLVIFLSGTRPTLLLERGTKGKKEGRSQASAHETPTLIIFLRPFVFPGLATLAVPAILRDVTDRRYLAQMHQDFPLNEFLVSQNVQKFSTMTYNVSHVNIS